MPSSRKTSASRQTPDLQWYRHVRRTVRQGALVLAVFVGATGVLPVGQRLARAQDDWDAVEKPANQPAVNHFQLPPFDQWVLGGRSPAQVRQTLLSHASMRLDLLSRSYNLTDPQRKKLELAARGDIKRFFRQADEVRSKFDELKNDQQKLNEIVQAIQPLQMKIQGSFFNDDSLLYKAIKTTFIGEQAEKFEGHEQERRRFVYEANIAIALVTLERGVPLREEQRKQFTQLLLEETKPPRSFGRQAVYAVFYQASTIDEDKLSQIFDRAQWKAIQRLLRTAEAMDANLKRNGFQP